MEYTIGELRKKLADKLIELGASPKFKENPAYKKIVVEIGKLMTDTSLMNQYDTVKVFEQDGKITCRWFGDNKQFDMTITVPSEKEIKCERTEKSRENNGNRSYSYNGAFVIDSKLEETGEITIDERYGTAKEEGAGEYTTTGSAIVSKYDDCGVQTTYELRGFESPKLIGTVPDLTASQIVPNDLILDTYYKRIIVSRYMLDVVQIHSENKKTGEKYFGKQQIHSEHGLSDMNWSYKFDSDFEVTPVTATQIEEMLAKEDPKVAEGLRKYTAGREDFSYSSKDDKERIYRAKF